MRFLIDECLSPDLVAIARNRGFSQSMHVTWLGLTSKKDWAIVKRAVQDRYVLVTNNTIDFTSLVGCEKVHSGLVCLNVAPGFMNLEVQKRLFKYALDQLKEKELTMRFWRLLLQLVRQFGLIIISCLLSPKNLDQEASYE